MFPERKKEIEGEIEKLLGYIKILENQDFPTDMYVRQIFKLLHEYTDLCLIECQQNKIALSLYPRLLASYDSVNYIQKQT